jgi:double stranded RNA-specific editase B
LVDRRGRFRAIYGRIENTIQGLPPPFRLNRPSMYLLTSSETRMPCKAPSFSVIWCTGLPQPEIINTNVGKPEKGRSKFCKYELMERFVRLIGNISSITEIEKNTPGSYSEAKEAVHSYKVREFHNSGEFLLVCSSCRRPRTVCTKRSLKLG